MSKIIDTTKLKRLIHALMCHPSSSENMHVEFSEIKCNDMVGGLSLNVYQSDGDYGMKHVFTHGEPFDVKDASKAKDFFQLVQEAEHSLQKLVRDKFQSLINLESYDDKIINFYNTYFPTDCNVSSEYFIAKAKLLDKHFGSWLEEKFFNQYTVTSSNFPSCQDFLRQYQRYCTFES
jgi:hypothetical protein